MRLLFTPLCLQIVSRKRHYACRHAHRGLDAGRHRLRAKMHRNLGMGHLVKFHLLR